MSSVEVLIPHHNEADSLRRTLASLEEQTLSPRVCVIDNGSTDDTPHVLAERPHVRSMRLDCNLGFGAAINRGAASSDADLLVLLNNDAVADPHFVEGLAARQRRSGAEMVAGCLRELGGAVETLGVEIDQSLIVYDYMHGAVHADLVRSPPPAPLAPSGGAAAFARDAFLAAGGFDEAIFAYLEDAELGLRMRLAGMRCEAAPEAFAWHEHSATLGARSARKNELLGWARGYVLWKHGAGLPAVLRARGLALDAVVIAGKALIDRDLGLLSGRLAACRQLRRRRRPPAPALDRAPLRSLGAREALARRLARRRPRRTAHASPPPAARSDLR